MKPLLIISALLLAGCADSITLPTPVAYASACPAEDKKCQRNLDAQTLHYIGESDAAVALLCQDKDIQSYIQSCGMPALY